MVKWQGRDMIWHPLLLELPHYANERTLSLDRFNVPQPQNMECPQWHEDIMPCPRVLEDLFCCFFQDYVTTVTELSSRAEGLMHSKSVEVQSSPVARCGSLERELEIGVPAQVTSSSLDLVSNSEVRCQ
ncbi:hypothetical protein TNCV_1184461 [Trichonephila clavipes]|nr:hypothetical protein TNCV_1184461 [Trichonephila clavipes]